MFTYIGNTTQTHVYIYGKFLDNVGLESPFG